MRHLIVGQGFAAVNLLATRNAAHRHAVTAGALAAEAALPSDNTVLLGERIVADGDAEKASRMESTKVTLVSRSKQVLLSYQPNGLDGTQMSPSR